MTLDRSIVWWFLLLLGGCGSSADSESVTHPSVHDRGLTSFGRATARKLADPTPTKEILEAGYSPAVSVESKTAKVPLVEAFPSIIRVPKGLQQQREVWLICNEDKPVRFEKAKFSCGCLEASASEGEIEPYGSRSVKVTVAAVDDRKGDHIVFPFRWDGREWEVKVAIVRQ
jgi:hypothetical protein